MSIFNEFPQTNFHDLNLDWIVSEIRRLADEWSEQQENWNTLYEESNTAIAEFKEYVTNYFNTLDLTDEVRINLNNMVNEGVLDPIIITVLSPVVSNWLDTHITTPSSVVIDSSLSIAGAAADAKAAGDLLRANSEVISRQHTIHQYNFLQYDFINGYYNANGQIISSATIKSYLVPIKEDDKFFYCNSNTSIALLDSGKNFVALAPKTSYTQEVQNSTVVISTYLFDASEYPTAKYVALPFSGGTVYLRGSNFNKWLPVLPIESTSACDDYSITFNYSAVVNFSKNIFKPDHASSGIMNIATGEISANAERYTTELLYLKAGTKITTKGSCITFVMRGINSDGPVIIDGVQEYIIDFDFIGTIDYKLFGWLHPGYAPQYTTPEELICFLQIFQPVERNNKWNGKSWYCYGTSLSDIGVDDSAGNNGYAGKYPLYIDNASGLIRTNGAIGSGGIRTSASHGGNVLNSLLQTPYNVDLVTLECLPNDGYDVPANVGEITDTGTTTICGAFKAACEYITNNTRAKMVILFVGGGVYSTDPMNSNHIAYINAKNKLKQIADMYGVDYIDAEKHAIDWAHKANVGYTMIDTIHLNYLGGLMIGKYIWNKLKDIEPNPLFAEM